MLIDHRTYHTMPGRLGRQLELYREFGFAIQRRHAGDPALFMTAESGSLNSYTHIWLYESAAHRERARAALQADPEWKSYLHRSAEAGNLVRQENTLMVPVGFWPVPFGSGRVE